MRVRYQLRDRKILNWVMRHPGRGAPYTVRTLAADAGCSPTLIGHLHSGRQKDCSMDDAHHIAEAVGVAVLVLFAPPPSPKQIDADTEPRPPA